jgi:tetratricopeptide (TPR) repeat protein
VMRKLGLVTLLVLVGACALKRVSAPVITAPRFPDFVEPVVPASFARVLAATDHENGWRFLQVGDLKNAQRQFVAALKKTPAFYPADVGLGYVALASQDAKSALGLFDRAIARQKAYAPALAGRGQALLALKREGDALAAFEAAIAADPTLTELRGRIEVLRFRSVEENLSLARRAVTAGRLDEAVEAYLTAIASSPESPFLYRELAGVERQKGEIDRAIEYYRRAVALDPTDARSFVMIGDILGDRNDLAGAERAYAAALALDADAEVGAKLERTRERAERAGLPSEYRAIDQSPQVTRADLAALIGVRFASLLQAGPRPDVAVVTDVRNNWAATWIMAVIRAGIMEPFPNHAFQPSAPVRRIDLAQVVSRLLARVAAKDPERASAWQSARLRFSDLSAGHLQYPEASAAVASGVLAVGPDNSFQPSRSVSGAEAIDAFGRLGALAQAVSVGKGTSPR